MKTKPKIGIFGATADPFTIAHLAIIEEVLNLKLVDKILIVPSIINYYRNEKDVWLSIDERIKCIKFFIEKSKYSKNIELELCEFDFKNTHNEIECEKRRSIDMILEIKQKYSYENDYFYIIGTDSAINLKTWHRWEDLIKEVKFIVVNGRNGEIIKNDNLFHDIIKIPVKYQNISASEIRKKYQNHKNGLELYLNDMKNEEKDELIAHTPIFDVVLGKEIDKGFKPVKIKSNDWVSIILEKDNKFLIVRQHRYGVSKEIEEFPCGIIENNEMPIDAAIRELHEETGIHVQKNDIQYLGRAYANPAFMTNFMYYFYLNLDNVDYSIGTTSFDEHENIISEWIDISTYREKFLNNDYDMPTIFLAALFNFYTKIRKAI